MVLHQQVPFCGGYQCRGASFLLKSVTTWYPTSRMYFSPERLLCLKNYPLPKFWLNFQVTTSPVLGVSPHSLPVFRSLLLNRTAETLATQANQALSSLANAGFRTDSYMVNAIPGRNLPVLNFVSHLPKPWTDRFARVNGKQPICFYYVIKTLTGTES